MEIGSSRSFSELAARPEARYALLFLLLWACAFIFLVVRRAVSHRRTGISFPDVDPEAVLYQETTASGRSMRSLFTRLSGAARCLRVTVTRDEVWIRPPLHSILPMPETGLMHRIKKASAVATRIDGGTGSNRVLLEYEDQTHQTHRLELWLRDPERFLSALRA